MNPQNEVDFADTATVLELAAQSIERWKTVLEELARQ